MRSGSTLLVSSTVWPVRSWMRSPMSRTSWSSSSMALVTSTGSNFFSLRQRLLDQPLVVIGVQRLARDLLGGDDGQVRDLLADLVERTLRLELDLAPGALECLLVLFARPLPRLALEGLGRLARANEDLLG